MAGRSNQPLPEILSAFAVPPHLLGPEPPPESQRQLAERLRAMARSMGLPFECWPQPAQDLEVQERGERAEEEWRKMDEFYARRGFGQYTLRDRLREWFRWPR